MSTDEAAWKAELREQIADLFRVKDGKYPDWVHGGRSASAVANAVLGVLELHIKAAEERGRREALTEAAEKIRRAYSGDEPDHSWVNNPYDAADLIDPDVP